MNWAVCAMCKYKKARHISTNYASNRKILSSTVRKKYIKLISEVGEKPFTSFLYIERRHYLYLPPRCFLFGYMYTDKKENKIPSYIRKSRRERLQSHIWPTASSFMTLQPLQSKFPYQYIRKFLFSFFSVHFQWWLFDCIIGQWAKRLPSL